MVEHGESAPKDGHSRASVHFITTLFTPGTQQTLDPAHEQDRPAELTVWWGRQIPVKSSLINYICKSNRANRHKRKAQGFQVGISG